MKKIYLLFVGLIFCLNLQSQISQFNDSSMYGGSINYYAKNSSCVLVATDGGIFKTTNQGQNWTNVSQHFDPNTVNCEVIFSINTDFYAKSNSWDGSGIFKSTDNGTNWSLLNFSTWYPQAIGKLSNSLYVVGGDMSGGRLYSSTDGSSWTPKAIIWDNNNYNYWCNLYSFNNDKLYLAFNDTLYYTTDGNSFDTISFNGLGESGEDITNSNDRLGGDSLGNLYYGRDELYKYDFNLKIWNDISTVFLPVGYQIMDISVTTNTIFINAMHPTQGIRLYKSTNQGSTFTEIITNLAIPMIGNIIEVATNSFIGNAIDDRVITTSNGGTTWTANPNQYTATYAGNLTRSGNTLLFSREIKGLITSNNQGTNWVVSNNGIPDFSGIVYFVNQITQVKDTLFSIVMTDPMTEQTALFKSSNNGTQWNICPITAPYNTGEEYVFAGKCDSALFISYMDTNTNKYALIVSFNNGSLWQKPSTANNSEKIFLKGPKNCLFAFYSQNNDWQDFTDVFMTNNFGTTFSNINTGNLFNDNLLIKRVYDFRGDKGGPMMDFDEGNNKAIFAVRDRSMGNGIDKLYLYNITTTTWSEITTIGLPANYIANCILYSGNNTWLLATNTGLYKSTNGGINWGITHYPNNWINGITINSIQNIANKSFLGTIANGVWVVDHSLGIIEQVKDNDLQIYPNPTADIANIVIPNFNGKTANVIVYSFDGKEIINKTVNNNQFQLNLKNLSIGSYFVVINSNNEIYKKTIIRK